MFRFYSLCALFVLSNLISVAHSNQFCAKMDFNQTVVSALRDCLRESLPTFVIKRYMDVPTIKPFRPTAQNFLSNYLEGYSCAESTERFTLSKTSYLEAAVYLTHEFRGAFVELNVIDADRNILMYSWRNESSTGWNKLNMKINSDIRNAQIELRSNVNRNGHLAIEYLYILNSAIKTPDCQPSPGAPGGKPPGGPTTKPPGPGGPGAKPPAPVAAKCLDPWIIASAILGGFLLIALIAVIIISFKWCYRPQSKHGIHQTTLPRMCVVRDDVETGRAN